MLDHGLNITLSVNTALCDNQSTSRNRVKQFKRVVQADLKCMQVAIVDPEDGDG